MATNKKPIMQIDMDGNIVGEWDSAMEANRNNHGTNFGSICIARRKKRPYKNFMWLDKIICDDQKALRMIIKNIKQS